jgi:death-on-curing protein
MPKPVWVIDSVVLAIHKRQISEHGGLDGIRDNGLLESALAKPRNLHFYKKGKAGIAEIAAACAYGISRNHPFIDGNKRTSLVICRLFLKLNGYDLKAEDSKKYLIFMELAAGRITEEELAKWIAKNI